MASRAKLMMSRVCRVPGALRPAPALFSYSGLVARPFHERHDAQFAPWILELESATEAIKQEYLNLQSRGAPSDYQVEGNDHGGGLHVGDWHW